MDASITAALRAMRAGVLLAMFGVLFGFAMGGLFGAFEDRLKGGLAADADAVLATTYAGDPTKAQAVVDKSWSYFKRAHLHGGGIGAASLAVMLILAAAGAHRHLSALAALAMGAGSLGYPVFWLVAGIRAPGMGGTGAAKESLKWLAVPSSGALLLGLALAIGVTAAALFSQKGTRD
jgi:hypothetical protein